MMIPHNYDGPEPYEDNDCHFCGETLMEHMDDGFYLCPRCEATQHYDGTVSECEHPEDMDKVKKMLHDLRKVS